MDLIEWQGKSRVEEGLREVGKRIGKNNMKTLSESFAYKEEQRHGLMVDRKCGVKGRLFFFSKKEKVLCSNCSIVNLLIIFHLMHLIVTISFH